MENSDTQSVTTGEKTFILGSAAFAILSAVAAFALAQDGDNWDTTPPHNIFVEASENTADYDM